MEEKTAYQFGLTGGWTNNDKIIIIIIYWIWVLNTTVLLF